MRALPPFLLCAALLGASAPSPEAVLKAFDHMASRPLWPNYQPGRIPLAIFDGSRTWLFRHPAPPAGFEKAGPEAWVYPGRWQEVTANTAALIGGHPTATLMLKEGTAEEWAAILIHEGFHAFQAKHPQWAANEAELFTYPVEDAEALALRRQEFEALRRALQAATPAEAKGWAKTALEARQARFAAMPAGSVGYERGSELNEGLAVTVELRASGRKVLDLMPPGELPAERIRSRAYATGPAMAQLLDRIGPGWDGRLEAQDKQFLDGLLREALGDTPAARFPEADLRRFRETAQAETSGLKAQRKATREAYLARPGWSVVLEAAPGAPLFPKGFDPLNVQRLGSGEILHTRFLRLGNKGASLELMGGTALTEGAGNHPLWNGVRRIQLRGLVEKPAVETGEDGSLRLTTPSLKARLTGAKPTWEGRQLVIRLQQ